MGYICLEDIKTENLIYSFPITDVVFPSNYLCGQLEFFFCYEKWLQKQWKTIQIIC